MRNARIELATLRLWDSRAASCANFAWCLFHFYSSTHSLSKPSTSKRYSEFWELAFWNGHSNLYQKAWKEELERDLFHIFWGNFFTEFKPYDFCKRAFFFSLPKLIDYLISLPLILSIFEKLRSDFYFSLDIIFFF